MTFTYSRLRIYKFFGSKISCILIWHEVQGAFQSVPWTKWTQVTLENLCTNDRKNGYTTPAKEVRETLLTPLKICIHARTINGQLCLGSHPGEGCRRKSY